MLGKRVHDRDTRETFSQHTANPPSRYTGAVPYRPKITSKPSDSDLESCASDRMVCLVENRNCDPIESDGLYFEVMEIEGEKMRR